MNNYGISNKKGFTLVELIMAISIFFVIVMMTSTTYFFYQKKASIRVATKDISQSIYEARNLAINGYNKNSENNSVGLFFDTNDNKLKIYSYLYTLEGDDIILDNDLLLKEKKLPDGIILESISGNDNLMFFFNSITGRGEYFYFNNSGDRVDISGTEIDIDISYKGAITQVLQRTITYYTNTNIVDF